MPEPPLHPGAVVRFDESPAVTVAVADTPRVQARGLMFRDGLSPVDGLLFVFDRADRHAFWMRHVRFTIDILWIDRGRVVSIAAAVPPCAAPPCPTYAPETPARLVLEVAAGFVAAHGIAVGRRVEVRFLG